MAAFPPLHNRDSSGNPRPNQRFNPRFTPRLNPWMPNRGTAKRVRGSHPGFFLSHFPLRVSLVAVITVLAGIGLLGSGVVVTSTLKSFMIQRVDEQLHSATEGWAHMSNPSSSNGNGGNSNGVNPQRDNGNNTDPFGSYDPDNGVTRPPSDFFVMVVDGEVAFRPFNSVNESMPEVRGLETPTAPITVPARIGSASSANWRASSVENKDGSVTIVALPLEDEEHTISRLVYLQFVIGLLILLALVTASLYLVRRALRPLNEVENTASLISQGQLDQRVPLWAPDTEVGRLSQALNRMLTQIQGAFITVGASEQQARRSEDTMRRFIGDASHELRTPLTSVRGYAELYTSGATNDANMVIERISAEAGRMSLLVEDLLALVRMDEGRPLQKDRVDVLELCLSCADNARAGFPGREVTVRNHSGDVPVVIGDASRLHQVITNLVTNALRHAGDNAKVQIALRVEDNEEKKERQVIIDVSDDGAGIPAEALPHLFERFYRTDVSRSRASGGSGLGLSIVKGLVESHRGSIDVSSTVGEGSCFTVTLPAADQPEDFEQGSKKSS